MTLWGGRFVGGTDRELRRFGDSISFDHRLYGADIRGSEAYARALARVGLLTGDELEQLLTGLEQVRQEFQVGQFQMHPGDEDIHTAVERRLGELIGPAAGKLHTGRSRNDQVATDLRMYLLQEMPALDAALQELQRAIVEKSEQHLDVVMPGYTHLQQAQPLLFSHWMMSFYWKLRRDRERLVEVERRTSALPLGAGALAGNPFGIDRQALAEELGFAGLCENSVDAVSDRDFVVDLLAWAALLQVHLSNLAEDLILWSSREFGFVEVDDAYATGSSLMPQKKNPDSLELMRGKSGRVVGHLVALLTVLKGLPCGYNKDLQEDKEGLFDVLDTVALELPIAAGVIRTLTVNEQRMLAALDDSMLATDLADYLVRKGVPFRESHECVGRAVKRAEQLGVRLSQLSLSEYQELHAQFGSDLYGALDLQRSLERRTGVGGTARDAVRAQIGRARELLTQAQP
jgi:argininosuccinate lyase